MYHKSIKTLPVYNFYEILNSGKLSFLYIGEEGEEDLNEVWDDIYNEYCEAAKVDNRNFKQKAKVEALKIKHSTATLLLKMCTDDFIEVRQSAKEALKDFNLIFRTDRSFQEEYNRLENQLNSLRTKISIEEAKLPKEDKKEAKNIKKQLNAMNDAVKLEEAFDHRKDIDIYTITVEKWIALNHYASEKSKIRRAS